MSKVPSILNRQLTDVLIITSENKEIKISAIPKGTKVKVLPHTVIASEKANSGFLVTVIMEIQTVIIETPIDVGLLESIS